MASAADIEATLRYLIPGFIVVKVFYWVGLKTRRTDLELALWSIVAAAVVNAGLSTVAPVAGPPGGPPAPEELPRLVLAAGVGAALGAGLGILWRLTSRRLQVVRIAAAPRVWDTVLTEPNWLQVWTKDGEVTFGYASRVAESVDTDDLDLYLERPERVVDMTTGARVRLPQTTGLLIARSEITKVQVLGEDKPAPDAGRGAQVGGT